MLLPRRVAPEVVRSGPCQEIVLGRRRRSRPAADPDQLARGRGAVHHAAGGDHPQPRTGQAQPRHVPPAASTGAHRMHWQIHKDGRRRLPRRPTAGCRSPSRSARSGHDLCRDRAAARDIDEYLFAGFLRGERVELVDCQTVTSRCRRTPRSCWRATSSRANGTEGPFGDHTGFYTPAEPFPVFHVTA